MPETSKLGEQMEQVGKDATESFGKGSGGLGDKIHESVTKSKDKIKDVFHRTGSDAGKSMSDAFKEETKAVEDTAEDAGKKASHKFRDTAKDLGKQLVDAVGPDIKRQLGDRLEDTVGGALDGVLGDKSKIAGKFARSIADWGFEELKDKLGGVTEAADKTKQAFADITSGNTLAGVSKLAEGFHDVGVEASDLPQPLQEAINKTGEFQTGIQGVSDLFKDMPGVIGTIGTAIGELAGPIAVMSAAVYEGMKGLQSIRDHIYGADQPPPEGVDPQKWKQFTSGPTDMAPSDLFNWGQEQNPGDLGSLLGANDGSSSGPDAIPGPGREPHGPAKNFYKDWYPAGGTPAPAPAAPAPAAPSSANTPSSFAGSLPSPSSRADLHASGSRVKGLYSLAQSLEGTPYSQQLRNDCSGMVSRLATAALGMEPSVQFSTVNEGDFLFSHGFKPGMGGPNDLSIGWYDHGGGDLGHTAATLPGGINAESGGGHGFQLGGKVGASSSQFEQHAYLPMGGSSGSINIPTGEQHNPLYVMAADKGSGGGGSSTESQAQQFGSGFLGGIAQSVGLDGSVFKTFGGSSNPMDFGIAKLGTGLLNWGAGMMGHGPGISANASQPATLGPTGAPTYNVDQSFNLTQHGVQGNGEAPYRAAMNSSNRTEALAQGLPG
jgi:hypothetical protein